MLIRLVDHYLLVQLDTVDLVRSIESDDDWQAETRDSPCGTINRCSMYLFSLGGCAIVFASKHHREVVVR